MRTLQAILCVVVFLSQISARPIDANRCHRLALDWVARVELLEDDVKIGTGKDSPPLVVEEVEALRKAVTEKHVNRALGVLDKALNDWSSVDPFVVSRVLEVIGEQKVEAGRPYALRFLSADRALRGARSVSGWAAMALAKLGGKASLEALVQVAFKDQGRRDEWMVMALSKFDAPDALAALETIASEGEVGGKRAALLMLSRYCSPTSKNVIDDAMRTDAPSVLYAATFWVGR